MRGMREINERISAMSLGERVEGYEVGGVLRMRVRSPSFSLSSMATWELVVGPDVVSSIRRWLM